MCVLEQEKLVLIQIIVTVVLGETLCILSLKGSKIIEPALIVFKIPILKHF